MMDFVDRTTASVLGLSQFKARLTPDSEWARAQLASASPFLPNQEQAWRRELTATKTVEAWALENPKRLQSAREALGRLPAAIKSLACVNQETVLGDPELFELKRFLFHAIQVLHATTDLQAVCSTSEHTLRELAHAIHPEPELSGSFRLSDALDPGLATVRKTFKTARQALQQARQHAEAAVIADHGGQFDVKGRYRPLGDVPQDPRLALNADGCWLADPNLKTLDSKLEAAQAAVQATEDEVRQRVSKILYPHAQALHDVREALAVFDTRIAKSRLRIELGGCWPQWSLALRLHEAYDPNLAPPVQRVDLQIEQGPAVVTGPNMGGKSSLLRAVGLGVWAAQNGWPVAANTFEFQPVHQIVYVGAEQRDDALPGLSSFGMEVVRLKEAWDGPSPRLFLLDEVGRGTHPEEGGQIAAEVIQKLGATHYVLASTHFPVVAAMPGAQHFRIRGLDHDALQLDDPNTMESSLRAAMSYAPDPTDAEDSVPRDARLVARALGLALKE